jgi:hypothetical protein
MFPLLTRGATAPVQRFVPTVRAQRPASNSSRPTIHVLRFASNGSRPTARAPTVRVQRLASNGSRPTARVQQLACNDHARPFGQCRLGKIAHQAAPRVSKGTAHDFLIFTPPLVVVARIVGPPLPISKERSLSIRPCTVMGKSTSTPPFTVDASMCAE